MLLYLTNVKVNGE